MKYNKTNYTRQIRKTDCFLALVANVIKWAGFSFNYRKEFYTLADMFEWDEDTGTDTKYIEKYFNEVSFVKSQFTKTPTFERMVECLNNNGAVAFLYKGETPTVSGKANHVAFVVKKSSKGFYFVNHNKKSTISELSDEKVKDLLKYPAYAAFLEKK